MKKIFTFLLVAFSFISFSLRAQLPFHDGFESDNLNNWVVSGNTSINYSVAMEGLFCFEGNDSYEIKKTFTPITNQALSIDFSMRAGQTNTNAVEFHVKDQTDKLILTLFFQYTGFLMAYDGSTAVELTGYEQETWYNIHISLNQNSRTYSVNIDDIQLAQGLSYQDDAADLPTSVSFRSTSAQSTGYVDNFTLDVDKEKDALMAFYTSMGGESWTTATNWNSDEPFHNWFGVTTDIDGHVIGIYMNNNNLVGSFPAEMGNLTYLQELDLSFNAISGTLPASFSQLANLSKLYLNHNQLSSEILPEFGSLSNLSILDLGSNNLTGTIPAELGNLAGLTQLLLWSNQLTGGIPLQLGNCYLLEKMGLSSNSLSGQIPDIFSELTNLNELIIGWNNFSGGIPPTITSLANLIKLELAGNQLTGTIPSNIGDLYSLNELFLQNNKLEGAVPSSIQYLTTLTALDLSENNLTVLPQEFSMLGISSYNIRNNFFTFEDLQNASPTSAYDPQKIIIANDTTYLSTSVTGMVQLDFDSDVVGSSYAWYLEGTYQSTTSGNSILATLTPAGTYYMTVEITNPDFFNFTLHVDSVVVIVQDAVSQTQTFDGYSQGEYLTVVNNAWTTFTNSPGSNEDALISDLHAQSTPNSVKIDGLSNVFYSFGNQTSGRHRINFLAFIPTGKNGYFLLQHNDTHGEELAVKINLLDGALGQLDNGEEIVDFTFWHDGWNNVEVIVDLDNDWVTLSNNGTEIHSWRWSNLTDGSQGLNQLGCINFFASQLAGNNEMYFDDFLVEQLNPVYCSNIGLVGTFNDWGNAGPDHALTVDASNPYHWFSDFLNTGTNEIKFRSNNEWVYNWGSNTFPTGTGIPNGNNIPITTGDYAVHFYCNTGYYNFETQSERTALETLYYATNGDNWTNRANWLSNNPINTWFGLTVNEEGKVTGINLENNNLSGTLPSEVGGLTSLSNLILSTNQIGGDIPAEIGALSNLTSLNLSDNQFSGNIPTVLGDLINLQYLYLPNNQLTGEIPSSLGNLSSIMHLVLNNNELSGSIPSELSSLSSLYGLYLDFNQLSGSIPSELGNLTNLSSLRISNNLLTGNIPSNLGNLSNLDGLDLSVNSLTGSIPSELGNLSVLSFLYLNSNQLSGSIPPALGNLSSLQYLNLNNNQLSGSIPSELINLTNLSELNLENNKFNNIPSTLSGATFPINLTYNYFTFEDLNNKPTGSSYSPQRIIPIYDTTYLETNITGLIQLDIDNAIYTSSYEWYREGMYAATTTGNGINATESSPGTTVFQVKISNPDYPGLEINIDSVIVITTGEGAYSQDFDAIGANEYLTVVDSRWKTPNNIPGSTEDALITSAVYNSFPHSAKIDGVNNVFFPLGSKTSGRYQVKFNVFVPDGKVGGFRLFQEESPIAQPSVFCQFNLANSGLINANGTQKPFVYYNNQWNYIEIEIDLDNDWAILTINSKVEREWKWSQLVDGTTGMNTAGSVNFVTNSGSGTPLLYFDDFYFTNLNPYNCSNIGLTGTFNNWGFGDNDIPLVIEAESPYQLKANYSYFEAGEVKFRQNQDWVINWGNSYFPSGIAVQNGSNIPVPSGTFTVSFNCATGDYNFNVNSEKAALQALYVATNGDYWLNNTNWNSTLELSNWYGIVTDASGNVIEINLDNNNLNGIIPAEIDDFQYLTKLHLSNNSLQGNLRGNVGNLSSLTELIIENNNLDGDIPSEIDLLSNLTKLKLSGNSLTGNIPSGLGSLDQLVTLELYQNQLIGSIPSTLGDLSHLEELNLNSNNLSGAIPFEIFNLTSLKDLILNENNLSGTIPMAIGALSSLNNLMLSGNDFTGTLPTQLGNLNQLNVLWLQNNNFEGEMMAEIAAIPSLMSLNFDHNKLSSIDNSYFYLSLDSLNAHMNNLTFEDVAQLPYNAQYAPQNTYIIDDTIHLAVDETREFELPFDQSVSTNMYTWYRDGELFNENASSLISITEEPTGETHYYYAIVTNPNFDQLTLYTDSLVVETESCLLSMTVATQDAVCYGAENGSITITAIDGAEPYEYSISEGEGYQTSNTFNVGAGTYMVMVKDAVGCQTVAEEYIINQPDTLGFTTNGNHVQCSGGSDGSIDVLATGGVLPYSYSIDGGLNYQTSPLFTGLIAVQYEVMVADANGCIVSDFITITQPDFSLSFTTTITHVLCNGDANGAIEFAASGGTEPYQYSIDDGINWQTSNLYSGLTSGSYDVVVKDANGCTSNDVAEISEPGNALSFTTFIMNASCFGYSNGSISFNATGGTEPYQYSIDDGTTWQTANYFDQLIAGEYYVSVKDANECTSNDMAIITESEALGLTLNITNVLCSGEANGAIEFNASGGTLPYQYSIDNGTTWQTSNIFSGLAAGTYNVSIQDALYCTFNDVAIITDPGTPLSFTTTITNVLCSGEANGAIVINASGGTSPYFYSIDDGNTWKTFEQFNGLAAGEYYVSVKDINNCTFNDVAIITEPTAALTFTTTITNVLCNGGTDGQIDFHALGGSSPYQFSIDDGTTWQSDSIFSALPAGEYNLSVKDANGCTTTDVATITDPLGPIELIIFITDLTCNGNPTGVLDLSAIGGTAPYQFSIDNGSTFQTVGMYTGLDVGTYQLVVKDANECIKNGVASISQPADALTFTTTITNVLCNGGTDGSIVFAANGGTAPYEYSIDNGTTWQTTTTFSGLTAGTYQVATKDANSCITTDVATITSPIGSIELIIFITDLTCNGNPTGILDLSAIGGTAPYQFSIDNGTTFQTVGMFTGLAAGTYQIVVKDANECIKNDVATISQPAAALTFTTTITNVLCNGGTDGSIVFAANGGTAPYEYSIDNGTTWQTTTTFSGLTAGTYQVASKDANACITNDVATITQPAASLTFTTTITNVLCNGGTDGSIVFAANGGTAPYEYSIDNGTTWQTTTLFSGLTAGTYQVASKDANACITNDVATITQPAASLTFTTTITNVLCNGGTDGSIVFAANGGTAPYEYSIDNGTTWQTTTLFSGLTAGTYQVASKDANACITNDVATITQPAAALTFTTTITNVLCNGGNNGSILFTASGGTAPFEYSIDNGTTWQTATLFSGLTAGTYQVASKDANACITNDVATITQPAAALTFTTTITNVLCTGDATGSIEFAALGGTLPYEYSTDNGVNWQTSSIFNSMTAGTYQVVVRDANLCQSADVATITEPLNALTFTANITDVTCFGGSDGAIEILASGGSPGYLYSIDGGVNYEVSPIFNNLVANNYNVMVIDNNSCETLIPQTVNQPASLPAVSFTGLDAEYCADAAAVVLTGNQAPEGSFTGQGITDNGDGTATFDPVLAGQGGPYDIVYSYTDLDGCSNSSALQTTVNALSVINFSGLSANYCIDGAAVIITGSEAPDGSFTGPGITDNGDGTAEFDPLSAGVGGPYSIVYEFVNLSGCTSQNTQTTNVIALPDVSFETLESAYCLGDAVVILVGSQAPNGTFTGTAITDNGDGTADFDPNAAGLGGPYSITYSYTDGFGCFNSDTQQTSVFDVPVVSFTGLNPNYCEGDAEIVITGSEAPNGSFSGNGVFDQGNGTAFFYPVVAGVGGPYNITYSFENASGCVGTDVQPTTVNLLPVASFTGLANTYCVTETAVTLTGNLAPNGVFSGTGITDNGDGTATFDPATAGAGGPFNITYSYTSPEGCSDGEVQQVTVNPNDAASFTGLDANYCSTESAVVLTGNLAPNGTFTGPGITDLGNGSANFDPLTAGVGGPYAILYSYTNTFGCYAEQSQTTEVFETPVATFSGLEAAYCIDQTSVSLTGNFAGGTFTGQGITDLGNGTALFNPATAGAGGPYDIQYEYSTPEGCTDNEIQTTEVVDFVAISFTQLEAEYCASDDPITLTGSMAPEGSFSGPGVVDNGNGTAIFSPELAGAGGPYTITYEYVSGGLCLNTTTQSVTIFPFTAVSFNGLDAAYCNVDNQILLTGSESPNGYFIGLGVTDNGDGTATFNPATVGVGGPYQISYYVENGGGCNSVSRQITSVVGDPEASFNFTLGGCNEDAVFIDESTSANGSIVAWNWNFDDPESNGSNTSTIQNPLHLFVSNQSTFNIELSVEDEMGCVGSVIQPVEPFSSTKISGTVISSQGDTIRSGYVLAFLYSNGVISTQVDSVQIMSDGSFTCNGLATCVEYIFHGYADADNYPGLIPRWHYDAFYWFDAAPVTVNWGDQIVEGVDINVFELVPPPQGNSSLSGGVFYFDSKGEPVKNVDVVLEYDAPDDKGDEIVGYDPTNELGAWGFDALGEGVFKIRVDIPGLSMDSVYTVTITAPDTHISGLNYYLDPETGIYIDFTGLDELEDLSFGSIGVMPNPSNGQFYLEILKAEHVADLDIQAIELWDMDGRLVKDLGIDFRGQHLITHVNLSDVEAGMYFIKVKNRGEVGIAKIVIQR